MTFLITGGEDSAVNFDALSWAGARRRRGLGHA